MSTPQSARRRSRRPTPGATPGTLVVPQDAPRPKIHVIDYCPDRVDEKDLVSPDEVVPYLTDDTPSITWVDVQGLGDRAVLEALGRIFEIHPLALADVVNAPQRPKVEPYEKHLFIITRMSLVGRDGSLGTEQVSIFLGKGFVLTFQETAGDCLDPVRERLRRGAGIIRKAGADYLAYAVLDAIIDYYFPIVEDLGERIEDIEDEVVRHPARGTLAKIYALKRELLHVRRAIWPQRESLSALARDDSDLVGKEARVYLRDCYDHAIQLIDVIESLREVAASLLDVYLSSVANRTNEVMKVLTVVSTIFIPLTFLVGVYGMNFNTQKPGNMPELDWPYGYVACWIFMISVAVSLLVYFGRRGWLRSGESLPRERKPRRPPRA